MVTPSSPPLDDEFKTDISFPLSTNHTSKTSPLPTVFKKAVETKRSTTLKVLIKTTKTAKRKKTGKQVLKKTVSLLNPIKTNKKLVAGKKSKRIIKKETNKERTIQKTQYISGDEKSIKNFNFNNLTTHYEVEIKEWNKLLYNCDILQNHCRWCKCSTPRLHTYLTINHKCDAYCATTLPKIENELSNEKSPLKKKGCSNVKSSLKRPENEPKGNVILGKVSEEMKNFDLPSNLKTSKEPIVRLKKLKEEKTESLINNNFMKTKPKNNNSNLESENQSNYKSAITLSNQSFDLTDCNSSSKVSLEKNQEIETSLIKQEIFDDEGREHSESENFRSVFGVSASLSIIPRRLQSSNETKAIFPNNLDNLNESLILKEHVKRENVTSDLEESAALAEEQNEIGCEDPKNNSLASLANDIEYVVVSDETLLAKSEVNDCQETLENKTGKDAISFSSDAKTNSEKNTEEHLQTKGNEKKTLSKNNRKTSCRKNSLSKRNKKMALKKHCTRKSRNSIKIKPSKPFITKQTPESDATLNNHPIYTNRSPTIKDIFGEISIKKEPTDIEEGISLEDFNKELQSVVSAITQENRAQKQQNQLPNTPNTRFNKTFAGLLNEDPNLASDIRNIVKKEQQQNSDDNIESPRPLQIDEDFETENEAALNKQTDSDLKNGPSKHLRFDHSSERGSKRKKNEKNSPKVDVASISFISPLKFKILLNSPKRISEKDDLQLEDGTPVTLDKKPPTKVKNKIKLSIPNNSPQTSVKKTSTIPDEFKCEICNIKYDTFEILADHLETHQKEGLILCCYCQKSFGDKTSMKRHIRTHTGERPYQCKVCLKRFSLPGNFKKHRDIHENIRTEPCSICGKTFRRKEHLKYHMRTHTGEKPFKCTRCGSCFTARYSLQIHMNIHLGRKPYKCSHCAKGFSDKSTMRKHIRVHTGEKPFKCTECNKCFGESGTLSAHMATHRTNRPHGCDQCSLKFKTASGLRQHQKIHYGEKQFSCKYCGMKFLQKYNMSMHERIHTGEKPYTCSHCSRSFRSRSCLGKHIVSHAEEEERKYQCKFCQKKFYRRAHLKRHEDMHLGVKPYKCEVCSKGFCTKNTLRNHAQTFHTEGARTFPCKNCGKVFKRRIYVRTHVCANALAEGELSEDELESNVKQENNEIQESETIKTEPLEHELLL